MKMKKLMNDVVSEDFRWFIEDVWIQPENSYMSSWSLDHLSNDKMIIFLRDVFDD